MNRPLSVEALGALTESMHRHRVGLCVDVTPELRASGVLGSNACDFCGRDLGRRRYTRFECRAFTRTIYTTAPPMVVVYEDYWAACRRCAPLVHARDWRALADRVVAVARAERGPLPVGHRSEVAALYQQVDRHLTGESSVGRWS